MIKIREWREADADAVVEACNDPLTRRYLPMLPVPYTQADALSFIGRRVNDLAVVDAASDEVLGAVGYEPGRDGVAEVGYWVTPAARGRRVATTAVELLCERLFTSEFQRLYLQTALSNTASQRVAIAAGFVREGIARGGSRAADGTRYDTVVWGRLADDPPGPSPRVLPDLPEGRLTDGVVTLRPLGADDAADTHRLRVRPEVRGSSVVATPPDLALITRQCDEYGSRWLAGERAHLTIRSAADDTYLGEIALYYAEPHLKEAMIGYSLTPEARGHGHAARAARLVTEWGFAIGMNRMIAGTALDNVASQRVLEAAGYTREAVQAGRLPGRIDNVAFAKLRPSAT